MNAKALIVFLVFLIWGQISWRWYTSGIKGFYRGGGELFTPTPTTIPPETKVISVTPEQIITTGSKTTIYFPYKSIPESFLKEISASLDELAERLTSSNAEVSITGHTDQKGSERYNLELGLQRATLVADELRDRGVSADLIKIRSKGESEPLTLTEGEGDEKNRRVEIEVLD